MLSRAGAAGRYDKEGTQSPEPTPMFPSPTPGLGGVGGVAAETQTHTTASFCPASVLGEKRAWPQEPKEQLALRERLVPGGALSHPVTALLPRKPAHSTVFSLIMELRPALKKCSLG